MAIKLDQTDRKILDILQKQAKITNAQLSKDIELSPAPTLERVKKLENSGIIMSYHAKLNTKALGLGVTTFVNVKLAKHNKENNALFLGKIELIPEVIECHHVTGNSHYLLKVITTDIEEYQKILLDKLSEIEEIDDLQSMMVLSTPKDSKTIPIP
ncbi:Lrp/AsnC family transcriptional regulator [Limibacter armeniacum]|uniref:Lrp/AsnC family transcriptional regulator n=1 Tax=Limibacter armeniacum TaxID=466084 RepID=UPI002FE54EFA